MFYVIPTIDAEGVHGARPFEQFMLGEVGADQPWGVGLLAKIFHSFGASSTFFLDVYEHSYYGKEVLARVTAELLALGQDVQLHTHPAWREDPRDSAELNRMKRERSCFPADKYWMKLNSLAEQVAILKHGCDCLKAWGAGSPIAHRAGAYAANADTLIALGKVGIPIDSSMHFGHANCDLSGLKNAVVEKDGVVEVPVTGFDAVEAWQWGPVRRHRRTRFLKTDVDWCSLAELKAFVELAPAAGLRVMNLFMHSYSLLRYNADFSQIGPDAADRNKLQSFLRFCLDRPQVKVISMAEFWRLYRANPDEFKSADAVPKIGRDIPVLARIRSRLAGAQA